MDDSEISTLFNLYMLIYTQKTVYKLLIVMFLIFLYLKTQVYIVISNFISIVVISNYTELYV